MFIIYSQFFKKEANGDKQFTIQIVGILIAKAHSCARQTNKQISNSHSKEISNPPRSISAKTKTDSGSAKPSTNGRPKYSDHKSMLDNYIQREPPPLKAHTRVKSKTGKRGECVWCALLWKEKELKGETVKAWNDDVKRTLMVCAFCTAQCKTMDNVFLCREHFAAFHGA